MFSRREGRFVRASDATKMQSAFYALKVGRHRDAAEIMTFVIKRGKKLSLHERSMFAVAFWQWAEECRGPCREIKMIRRKTSTEPEDILTFIHANAENELSDIVKKVFDLISVHLLPKSNTEEKLFYYKMLGDFSRYLATVAQNADREYVTRHSKAMYEKAFELSSAVPAHHPYQLGTVLNYAVLFYEVYHDIPKAISIAEKGLCDAQIASRFPMALCFPEMDYVVKLTEANIQRWRTVIKLQEAEKHKLDGAATVSAAKTTEADTEELLRVDWSHSFTLTPGSFPKLEDLLTPSRQEAVSSTPGTSNLPSS